jgi:hypothetical protein
LPETTQVPIRFTINGDGNVGIGASTTPVYKLEVSTAAGSERIRVGTLQNNSNTATFEAITSAGLSTATSGWIRAVYGGGLALGTSTYTKSGGDSGNFANLSAESATTGITVEGSGLIVAPYMVGKSFSMTSGGGTGTATTDTGIYVSSGDWGGFGRSSTYLITFSANPNNGGSGEYSAVHVGYITVYTGWNGSAVTTYIDYTQVAVGNNIGVLTLSPRFWNGSTESSNVARGSISGYQIRIKISGYNSSHTGANQALYIQKIITSG